VAEKHPQVVTEIQGRVARLLAGFPEEIQTAHAETLARWTIPAATGAVPKASI